MLDDQIGFAGAQLVQPVVAREHRAGKNASVPRRLDVVLHVTDEQGLGCVESVLPENFQNSGPLVPNLDVGVVEEPIKAGRRRLSREMVAMNGAQQKSAQAARAAKEQHVARVRQLPRQVLDLPEMTVKPLFQLWQENMRKMAAVKVFERKAELGPKLVERQFLHAGLLENVIGRPPDSGQIVHQRSGPIENNVPNHGRSLMAARLPATHKQPAGRSTNRQIQNGRLAGP